MTVPAEITYRPARLAPWRPKEWTPVYEQVVMLSCMNRSNVDIGQAFGFTPQHVSNILRTPEAALTRRRILETLRDKVDQGLPKRLSDLADKAVQRVAQVLYDDEKFEKSPFAVVDRALSVLRGVGKLKTASELEGEKNNQQNNVFIFSGEDMKDMKEGLARARKARELHPVEVPTTGKELEKAS